jgi:diguanylate cyclase (GGDEF)-like protein
MRFWGRKLFGEFRQDVIFRIFTDEDKKLFLDLTAMGTSDSGKNDFKDRILLIGDAREAFVEGHALNGQGISLYEDINAGVNAAATGSWDTIVLVISSARPKLKAVLSSIRKTIPGAKIVLLSRMSEEPAAIELVKSSNNGSKLADDYLICPLEVSDFFHSVVFSKSAFGGPGLQDADSDVQMQKKLRELEILATTDDLTGLKNRRYVWEFCSQIIEYTRVRSGRVTLLMFDIDYFKHYNDTYSHSAGDEILKQVAVLIRRSCRPHDVVGRIGGDEFVVIFWDVQDEKSTMTETDRRSLQSEHPKEAILIASRFRAELKKAQLSLLGAESQGVLTISGGLASFPRDGSTAAELFEQADRALLEAKRSGKNRIYLVGKSQDDIGSID